MWSMINAHNSSRRAESVCVFVFVLILLRLIIVINKSKYYNKVFKLGCIDKSRMWQSAMETDAINKLWRTRSMWLQICVEDTETNINTLFHSCFLHLFPTFCGLTLLQSGQSPDILYSRRSTDTCVKKIESRSAYSPHMHWN